MVSMICSLVFLSCLGLVAHDDPVAKHIRADAFDILRRHVTAPGDKGARPGRQRERDRRPRSLRP